MKENLLLLQNLLELGRTKSLIYTYNAIPKKVYIDKLHNIVNKYNSLYHQSITMNPVDVSKVSQVHTLTFA